MEISRYTAVKQGSSLMAYGREHAEEREYCSPSPVTSHPVIESAPIFSAQPPPYQCNTMFSEQMFSLDTLNFLKHMF